MAFSVIGVLEAEWSVRSVLLYVSVLTWQMTASRNSLMVSLLTTARLCRLEMNWGLSGTPALCKPLEVAGKQEDENHTNAWYQLLKTVGLVYLLAVEGR